MSTTENVTYNIIKQTDTLLFCQDLEEHIKRTYTYINAVPNLDSFKVLHTDEYITCDKVSIIDETNSTKYCKKLKTNFYIAYAESVMYTLHQDGVLLAFLECCFSKNENDTLHIIGLPYYHGNLDYGKQLIKYVFDNNPSVAIYILEQPTLDYYRSIQTPTFPNAITSYERLSGWDTSGTIYYGDFDPWLACHSLVLLNRLRAKLPATHVKEFDELCATGNRCAVRIFVIEHTDETRNTIFPTFKRIHFCSPPELTGLTDDPDMSSKQ